jgi:hypothetical protein
MIHTRLLQVDQHLRTHHDRFYQLTITPYNILQQAELVPQVLLRTKGIPAVEQWESDCRRQVQAQDLDKVDSMPMSSSVQQQQEWVEHVQTLLDELRTNRRYQFDDDTMEAVGGSEQQQQSPSSVRLQQPTINASSTACWNW